MEHVSTVTRRSLSNVTRDLKKAVSFGDYFLEILEFFVSYSDVLNLNLLRKVETRILYANSWKKKRSQ